MATSLSRSRTVAPNLPSSEDGTVHSSSQQLCGVVVPREGGGRGDVRKEGESEAGEGKGTEGDY